MPDIYRETPLYVRNARALRFKLETRNSAGSRVRYEGESVTFSISATEDGAAIVGLGPFTLTRDGAGDYVYEIPTANLEILDDPAYHDTLVYGILRGGPAAEVCAVIPYRVTATRYVA